jgi:peptidoglycan/xylan/chitin deacetylase (PgdA/CDA1 family)
MRIARHTCSLLVLLTLGSLARLFDGAFAMSRRSEGAGNRLAYLDEPCDPYYPGLDTPKLITPQWVGEPGVEAVIVLATDDLREAARHESFLRPILERLKKIDGHDQASPTNTTKASLRRASVPAPVSLMANRTDPSQPQLQKWLAEGATLEAHTWDHPCPLLQGGNLTAAKRTYDRAVDLLAGIANNRPVAFRMPCCDSMSSVSPRFFTEIFNRTTPQGNFLAIDSSVFMLFTANDPELPRRLVLEADGGQRFRRYVPTDRVMANLIEDYPYPYVIGRLCWEIPVLMPSDWDAQNRNGVCSPATVRDLKAAVDAVVIKRGIFALCFHPHGWIRNDQIVEVIDHAVSKYGRRVKFLTFREVYDRLTNNLLGGQPLRAANGQEGGARVLDLDGDRTMDVVIGNDKTRQTRLWSAATGKWTTSDFPAQIVAVDAAGGRREAGVRFGVFSRDGRAGMLVRNEKEAGAWQFDGRRWKRAPWGLERLELDPPVFSAVAGRDQGVRLRDLNGDGVCEAVVSNPVQQAVFSWTRLPFALPKGATVVDRQGRDAGLRLVDIDEDGRLDVVFSNPERYLLYLFTSMSQGWSRKIFDRHRGGKNAQDEIPPIVRADGTNNGAWFAMRHMWVQNEDTGGKLPGHVFGRHFTQLLDGDHEPPRSSGQVTPAQIDD